MSSTPTHYESGEAQICCAIVAWEANFPGITNEHIGNIFFCEMSPSCFGNEPVYFKGRTGRTVKFGMNSLQFGHHGLLESFKFIHVGIAILRILISRTHRHDGCDFD